MAQNVKFFFTSDFSKYQNLEVKDPLALYFVEDPSANFYALFKGDNMIATGSVATTMMSGLMTPEDRRMLDELAASGGLDKLVAVDGSISIVDGEDGNKNISVAISGQEGNALQKKDDGLFVALAQEVEVPEYSIEKQAIAEEGYASSYKLKKVINGETSYVGDTINIAKDMVLQSAVLKKVVEADVPYEGAEIGDPYIEMAFNDAAASYIYVPVKDLVDTYISGDGIKIENNVISVELGSDVNGLHIADGKLNLGLATAEAAGAMSVEDKKALDKLVALDISATYATKTELQDAIADLTKIPNAEQFDTSEDGVFTIRSVDAEKIMYNGQKLSDILDSINTSYTWEELSETVSADATNAASAITAASEYAIVQVASGVVTEEVNLDKSVTVEGENANVPQNFSQEV